MSWKPNLLLLLLLLLDTCNVNFIWCVQAALCSVKTGLEAAIVQRGFTPML